MLPERTPHRPLRAAGHAWHLILTIDALTGAAAVLATGLERRWGVVLVALGLVALASGSLYRHRFTLSALDDLPSLAARALIAGSVVATLAIFTDNLALAKRAAPAALLWGFLLVVGRAVGYELVRAVRRRRGRNRKALVVGAGRVGGQVARSLLDHPEYGLVPVGYVDDNPLDRHSGNDVAPMRVLGRSRDLAHLIRERGIHHVVLAFGSVREHDLVALIRECDRMRCEIYVVPRLFELCQSTTKDTVWGVPLAHLPRAAFRSPTWQLKRAMDRLVGAVALLVAAPAMLTCAVALKWETGAGVLFRQRRIGLDGRPFVLLKFQTLKPADDEESRTRWNVADDSRLGPVGRMLRKTSLDELPQLWNVVRGDMSLVGPRPERPYFVEEFASSFPRYTYRHRVPSGLTGWAQIHGLRGDTSIEDRVAFDNFYIERWSLWGDFKIMLRTVPAVLRRSGG